MSFQNRWNSNFGRAQDGGGAGLGAHVSCLAALHRQQETISKRTQILEIVSGVCDGRMVYADSNDYTLPNVNQTQLITKSVNSSKWVDASYNDTSLFTTIDGSLINYKPLKEQNR